jgi:UDP-2-acetamido-3-amino-2,3-dideoxy-glucuronate N-acetyltransferase
VIDATAFIDPTAIVEDGATIGARSKVWGGAVVRRGARIGADCIIGRGAFIDADVSLGDRCKVQNLALVYHGVTAGNGVFIGPNAILTNDRFPRAQSPDGGLADASDWVVSPIRVGDGVSIGAGAVIVAGVTLGDYCMVGAGGVASRDISPRALVVGSPAKRIGWVCDCGSRLPNEGTTLTCGACSRTYSHDIATGGLTRA